MTGPGTLATCYELKKSMAIHMGEITLDRYDIEKLK